MNNFGWMTDNDNLLTGSIAAGTWTVYIKYNLESNCTSLTRKRIDYLVYKADSDLANPSSIQSDFTAALSAGENTLSDSWSESEVTLSNQVLYIQFAFEVAGNCAEGESVQVNFYTDEGATEKLDLPVYSAIPENSIYFAVFIPFIPLIVKRIKQKQSDLKII